MSTIKDMLQTVEIEQRKKLEQLSQQAAKQRCFFLLIDFLYELNSSAPIVPIGPSTNEFKFDQKSSSMVNIKDQD